MQDRYAGDIGDFAKFALLRALLGDGPFRLGLVWYLTSQASDPAGDGRHIRYLDRTPQNDRRYRSCDPVLHDSLARMVSSGVRSIAAYPQLNIMPPETVYVDTPLLFDRTANSGDRVELRTQWVHHAATRTAACDIVMFDPDNGLEVKSTGKYTSRGTKYVFFDELTDYASRGQTIIIYQHANRSGSLAQQVRRRLTQLQEQLSLTGEPFGLIWRTVSSRAFLVAPASGHEQLVLDRTNAMCSGPLGQHFEKCS